MTSMGPVHKSNKEELISWSRWQNGGVEPRKHVFDEKIFVKDV